MPEQYIWTTPAICGGINNTLPEVSIGDDELSDARNYQPDLTGRGWMIKREGLSKQDSNQRTAQFYSVFGGRNTNYYHAGTVVYSFGGTSFVTGRAAAADSWCSFGTYDCFVNGTDAIKVKLDVDGTTPLFYTWDNIPSGVKYVATANGFIYAAGHDKGKLRYSSYGLLETWPASNELIFSVDEGDDIVGLAPVKNGVLAACTRSFYIISGYSETDQGVAYFDRTVGCASAPRSIVPTPYGVFMWTKSGLCRLGDGFKPDFPMQRKLASTLAGLNRAKDAEVHGVWDSVPQRLRMWLFSGANQATANLLMDYYPQSDSFYLHTGVIATAAASGVATISGVERVYIGGYNPSYLYKVDSATGTDDGTGITSYLETKREGSPLVKRNGKSVVLTTDLTTSEDITYGCYQDHATSLTQTVSLLGVATGGVDTYIALNQHNKRLKHRVADSATTRTRIVQLTHSGTGTKII